MNESLERLREVLDAYGAAPERWPDEERTELQALLDRSAEARALRDDARRLDALLDAAPELVPPTDDLIARVLDAAPAPKTPSGSRSWGWTAAIPVAAAAALALWITRGPSEAPGPEPIAAQPDVSVADEQIVVADLGIYETPTDVLLVIDGFDPLAGVPGYDCEDSDLGCLDLGAEIDASRRQSMQGGSRRIKT